MSESTERYPIARSSLARVLATHSLQYGLAGGLGKVVALLTVPYLTRTLSPEGYGLTDLATSLSALLTLMAMFGGDIAAARLLSRATTARDRRSTLTMYVIAVAGISTLVAASFVPFSASLAETLWNSRDQAPIVALALCLIPLSATQSALTHVQRLERRPTSFAGLAAIDLTAQAAFAVLFVSMGLGPSGVLIGFIVGSGIGLASAGWAAKAFIGPPLDPFLLTRLVREGLTFLPATALFVVADYALRAILANVAGEGAVGYFAVAARIASLMTLGTYAFSMAWGAYGFTLGTRDAMSRAAMSWYLTLALGGGLALAVVAPEAVLLAAGPEYEPAIKMVPGLLAGSAIAGAYFVLVISAGVVDRTGLVVVSAVTGALVQTSVAIGLVTAFGPAAIALATVTGQASAFLVLGLGLPVDHRQLTAIALVPPVSFGLAAILTWASIASSPALLRLPIAGAILVTTGFAVSTWWTGRTDRPESAR
jgi:O-antigen/teichoic acid export membrane protein